MVHAEAANFTAGFSKKDAYARLLEQARALLDGQRNWVMTFWIIIEEPD